MAVALLFVLDGDVFNHRDTYHWFCLLIQLIALEGSRAIAALLHEFLVEKASTPAHFRDSELSEKIGAILNNSEVRWKSLLEVSGKLPTRLLKERGDFVQRGMDYIRRVSSLRVRPINCPGDGR